MLRKTKASMLTLATVLAAGCAHTDLGSKARKNASWALLDQPKHENMKEIPEPKILPQTYFAAAKLLEQEGEIRAAITQYRKAIAVNHNFVGAYHRLGLLLSSMGLHDEAIQSLSRATMMAPANVVLRNNYGFTLMVAQRWEEAAAQFRRCTELQPQFTRAYVNLGMTLTRLDRFDDALATFRKVLPEPDAYYNLGLMYRVLGRYDDAADSFRSALAANPAFVAASAELSEISDPLAPEKAPTPTVVTAIPLGRGADKNPTHASPMPAKPQANPTNETHEFVVVEAPILIADSIDARDAEIHPNSATSEAPLVGPSEQDLLYQTRTRDALI
ncbi:MAG: tetratricopeptide repeat protein, partial [Planctomycetes bacterium]|nr:tetratricopeptide repeat protein [Planctomycetota bacterium]